MDELACVGIVGGGIVRSQVLVCVCSFPGTQELALKCQEADGARRSSSTRVSPRARRRSQWVMLSREAVRWLLEDETAVAFAQHAELTYMSDETFVQTALMNSPLRDRLVNHNLRCVDGPLSP